MQVVFSWHGICRAWNLGVALDFSAPQVLRGYVGAAHWGGTSGFLLFHHLSTRPLLVMTTMYIHHFNRFYGWAPPQSCQVEASRPLSANAARAVLYVCRYCEDETSRVVLVSI